jgi:BirA family transcriptional regulator, biotin operon repressor / biotin---[acetyl-CoA-carboxylase] ligase
MNVEQLNSHLSGLPIPELRYFDQIGSTNDEALKWIAAGAEEGCLVIADQQTQGRGRLGRRWITKPGAALAFSLILHPTDEEKNNLAYFSPLGALAISQALEETDAALQPLIKWPNDVLLQRRKTAGILVEAGWLGEALQGIVVGIGINVGPEAVPPPDQVLFPAISVEEAAGKPIDRLVLLRSILSALFQWRARLHSESFRQGWEQRLAFKNEWVSIEESAGKSLTGQVMGLDPSGNLILRTADGALVPVDVGDVHLRLLD